MGAAANIDVRMQRIFALILRDDLPCRSRHSPAPLGSTTRAIFKGNALLLRNLFVVNMLNGCAISLPGHTPDHLHVDLMLRLAALCDDNLQDLALSVEAAHQASLLK